MKPIVTTSPPGEKPGECLTLDALRGNRVYVKDLNPGDLIEVPKNAEVARGLGPKVRYGKHQRVFYGYTTNESSEFLRICLLDPRWAEGVERLAIDISIESGRDAACDFISMVGEKWQLAKKYDGYFKVITPACDRMGNATPFELREVSHAA